MTVKLNLTDLLYKDHLVSNIANVKSRFNKRPLPKFYVDVDPNPNYKNVFDIHGINHGMVLIKVPKKINEIMKCHRCQEFEHSKTYC